MKSKLTLASLITAFALVATSVAQADTKIGFVDMNKIFAAYYKTDQAKKRIDEAQAAAQKELQDQVDLHTKNVEEIQKLDADLQKPELSNDAKEKKARERNEKAAEAQKQQQSIVALRDRRLKDLQDQAARMRQGIVDEILAVINDRVKAENYDLVLDKSGMSSNGVQVVLYSRSAADFSDDVIKILNANKPKDGASDEPLLVP